MKLYLALIVVVSLLLTISCEQSEAISYKVKAMKEKELAELAVGFERDVPLEKAIKLLTEHGLPYEHTDTVRAGKQFFYETGEKFLVKVPRDDIDKWIYDLEREDEIKHVTTPSAPDVFID